MLSKGLNLVWRWSEKFPGSVPVTLFKEYIARVQFDTDYYYTAYPQATANDVKSAHIVQASFDQPEPEPSRPARSSSPTPICNLCIAGPGSPGRDRRSTRGLLGHHESMRLRGMTMPNQSGSVYGLTILSPIIDDPKATPSHDLQIREYLAKLAHGEDSPFAHRAGHAPGTPGGDGRRDLRGHAGVRRAPQVEVSGLRVELRRRSGQLSRWPGRKHSEHLDAIWSHCVGYPGAANRTAFIDYMKACQMTTTFFFAAVNDKTVTETLRALQTQRAVADFIATHQGMDAGASCSGSLSTFCGHSSCCRLHRPARWGPYRAIKTGGRQ